jgi:hypothetical protein
MDCRRLADAVNYTEARKLDATGDLPLAIWHRGQELLRVWERGERPSGTD